VILVLGPGGARGYAYVGALRAIAEAKIPVAAVYGTEMGALFGALYAMSGGSISQFEWGLLKFPDDVFVQGKSLIPNPFGKSSDGRKLESALSKAFGDKDLRTSRIPVRVALRLKEKDRSVAISEGLARQALRAAVAAPGLFDAGLWDGQSADSAGKVRPFLVSEARANGKGSVIVIDASGDPRSADLPELKDADFVLRPDMKGIGAMDFSKKTEAAFRGKTEVVQHLSELRHLAGMPNEGPSP
jgi:NTE family protein